MVGGVPGRIPMVGGIPCVCTTPVHPCVYATLYIPGYTTPATMLGDTAAAGDGCARVAALRRAVA